MKKSEEQHREEEEEEQQQYQYHPLAPLDNDTTPAERRKENDNCSGRKELHRAERSQPVNPPPDERSTHSLHVDEETDNDMDPQDTTNVTVRTPLMVNDAQQKNKNNNNGYATNTPDDTEATTTGTNASDTFTSRNQLAPLSIPNFDPVPRSPDHLDVHHLMSPSPPSSTPIQVPASTPVDPENLPIFNGVDLFTVDEMTSNRTSPATQDLTPHDSRFDNLRKASKSSLILPGPTELLHSIVPPPTSLPIAPPSPDPSPPPSPITPIQNKFPEQHRPSSSSYSSSRRSSSVLSLLFCCTRGLPSGGSTDARNAPRDDETNRLNGAVAAYDHSDARRRSTTSLRNPFLGLARSLTNRYHRFRIKGKEKSTDGSSIPSPSPQSRTHHHHHQRSPSGPSSTGVVHLLNNKNKDADQHTSTGLANAVGRPTSVSNRTAQRTPAAAPSLPDPTANLITSVAPGMPKIKIAPGGARRGSTFSSIYGGRGTGKVLLRPLDAADQGKKCLVLDLDETLVHSSFKLIPHADYVVPVEIEQTIHNVYVIKRPGVDDFLRKMGEHFEVVVFTASLAKYADPVLDMLDKHKVIKHRLFRESCYNHKGNYVKDLSQLGRDIRTVIIIDNSPASYIFHPTNAVPITSWFNDPHDTELTELVPFLEDLTRVDNVMVVLDQATDDR